VQTKCGGYIEKVHTPSGSVAKPTTSFLLHGPTACRSTPWITAWQTSCCTHGVKRAWGRQWPEAVASTGICAAHSRHSFLSSPRELKQNCYLFPSPTTRILFYTCALRHKGVCILKSLVACARHSYSASSVVCSCACPQRRREAVTALPVWQEAQPCWRAHQH